LEEEKLLLFDLGKWLEEAIFSLPSWKKGRMAIPSLLPSWKIIRREYSSLSS
jgi:hypothetical protein